jgi:hypothetical protein
MKFDIFANLTQVFAKKAVFHLEIGQIKNNHIFYFILAHNKHWH